MIKLGHFELEPRHFQQGLTAKDFEAYTGQKIYAYNLLQFPHWNKLATDYYLPEKAFAARTHAMSHVAQRASQELGLPPAPNDWLNVGLIGAQSPSEYIHSYYISVQFADKHPPYNPLYLYWDAPEHLQLANQTFKPEGAPQDVSYVVPNVFYQKEIDHAANRWNLKFASLAFLVPMKTDYNFFIAPGINRAFVPRRKDIKRLHLISQVHDLRHSVQAFPDAASEACDYYCEVEADLFALKILRDGTQSREASDSFKLHRYFDYLNSYGNAHWTASALQAEARRHNPPSFNEIKEANAHFLKVIMNDVGLRPSEAPDLLPNDHKNWSLWHSQVICARPDLAFPHIIQLHKDGQFKDNALTQEIAEGVIEAARCFVPEAAKKPWPQNRKMLMVPH